MSFFIRLFASLPSLHRPLYMHLYYALCNQQHVTDSNVSVHCHTCDAFNIYRLPPSVGLPQAHPNYWLMINMLCDHIVIVCWCYNTKEFVTITNRVIILHVSLIFKYIEDGHGVYYWLVVYSCLGLWDISFVLGAMCQCHTWNCAGS